MASPHCIQDGVPVFRPSYDEFRDFESYVESIEPYGSECGIVKVVPPPEWQAQVPDYAPLLHLEPAKRDALLCPEPPASSLARLSAIRITKSIRQLFSGSNGLYFQMNLESRKSYTVQEFQSYAETLLPATPGSKRKREAQAGPAGCKQIKVQEPPDLGRKATLASPQSGGLALPSARLSTAPSELAALERLYWSSLAYRETCYGADLPGSLFPEHVKEWSVNCLPGLLSKLPQAVPGVNTPYLYFGAWKSTFSWHVEDMDLFSINYLHFGAPKQWYAVGQADRLRFEGLAKEWFGDQARSCRQFLRHKSSLISPKRLAAEQVTVRRMTQWPGEFMITFPYGYHAGFNYGFNCAESANFAITSWLPKGLMAERCYCRGDNVRIDVSSLLSRSKEDEEREKIKLRISIKKTCSLCLGLGRAETEPALQLIRDGLFAHASCIAYYELTGGSEPAAGSISPSALPTPLSLHLAAPPLRACSSRCMICYHQDATAVPLLTCGMPGCAKTFHLGCAMRAELAYPSLRCVFCLIHSPAHVLQKKRRKLLCYHQKYEQLAPSQEVYVGRKQKHRYKREHEHEQLAPIQKGTILQISRKRRACLVQVASKLAWIRWSHLRQGADGKDSGESDKENASPSCSSDDDDAAQALQNAPSGMAMDCLDLRGAAFAHLGGGNATAAECAASHFTRAL